MKTQSTIVMLSVVGMVVALAGSTQAELIAHYAFDEASGTNADDSSGSATSHDGELIGTSFTGSGVLTLDGSNDYVQLEGGAAEQGPTALQLTAFTLAIRFKRTGAGLTAPLGNPSNPLISKGRNGGDAPAYNNTNYLLGVRPDGKLHGHFEQAGGTDQDLMGETVIVDGEWYHAAMTYDGTTLKLYLNGDLDASQAFGVAANSESLLCATIGSTLGTVGSTALGFFEGEMYDARIYDSALSQPEIATIVYGAPGTLIYGK